LELVELEEHQVVLKSLAIKVQIQFLVQLHQQVVAVEKVVVHHTHPNPHLVMAVLVVEQDLKETLL
jgi:predicted transcriptional regulator